MRVFAPIRRLTIAGLFCVAALWPAAAQQRPDSTRAPADTARSTAAPVTLPGPRLPSRWMPAEQQLVPRADRLAPAEETHTFRLTTLEIILIIVLVFILIVR